MTTTKEVKAELATRAPDAIEQPAANMLDVIRQAVSDPRIDVMKMKELFALSREIERDAAVKSFRAAKARLCADLPQIGKDGRIVHGEKLISRYARLEDIDQAIRPLLAREGFSFSFDSHPDGQQIVYTAELAHRDGHAETKSIRVAADNSGAKNAIQGVGSATTYARRYLIEMHLNLIERGKDDDGNGGNVFPITKEHACELAALLEDARNAGLPGFDDKRLLKWLNVTSFDAMFERDFERVRDVIKKKRTEAETKK